MSVVRLTLCLTIISAFTGCGALRNITDNKYRPTRELAETESAHCEYCKKAHPDPPFKGVHDAIDKHINTDGFQDSFWYNPYDARTGSEGAADADSAGFRTPRSKADGSRQANKVGGPVVTK
ncbi:MAG: hypothetical protein ACJZ8O_02365 [Pirellulaceae bacterium]